jgi:transcriptional regulator with GAF, ATPase, and Fis domain/tRNA A-37 threonylcarbamoyl transferase component Bud32/tetratricopeptide (TPR) repeat protein
MCAANLVGDAPGSVGLRPGALVDDRYLVQHALGEGSEATAYAALDRVSGQRRALKFFRVDGGALAASRASQEFRRLHEIAHRSVVRVWDLGRSAEGELYLVTDEVRGPPLVSIAAIADPGERRKRFEIVARDLADALAYLHGRGVIHGDISPVNIRLDAEGRPVLFDFGLAGAPRQAAGGAAGTLGYAAPEALVGERGTAGDLFALGASLFEAWTGTPPFGVGMPAVQRMLAGRAPLLSSVRGGLPAEWDAMLARLLEPQAEHRPASARDLLRDIAHAIGGETSSIELDLRAPHSGGDPLAGVVVGRVAEREALRSIIERLAEGSAPRSVVAVSGPPGSGRRTLIDLALRDVRIARAAQVIPRFEIVAGGLRELAARSGAPGAPGAPSTIDSIDPAAPTPDVLERPVELEVPIDDQSRRRDRRFAALADRLENLAHDGPLCVVLDEDPDAAAFAAFVAGAEPSGRLLLVIPAASPLERPFSRSLELPPLSAEAVAEMVRRAAGEDAPPDAAAEIARASAGHAGVAALLTRRLVDAIRAGDGDRFAVEAAPELHRLLRDGFAALPPRARRLAVALALEPEDALAPAAALAEDERAGAAAAARAAGWIVESPTGDGASTLRLASGAHRQIVMARLDVDPELRGTVERAERRLPADGVQRAEALAALGRAGEAAVIFRRAAELAEAAPDLGRAAAYLQRAEALAPDQIPFASLMTLVSGLATLGRYDEAHAAIERAAARAACAPERIQLAERTAWLRARQGDLAGARAALEAALVRDGAEGEPALGELRTRLGRLLVTMGRFDQALAVVGPALARGGTALAIETALLARAYSGDLAGARVLLVSLQDPAAEPRRSGRLEPARLFYLTGLVDQLDGKPTAAVASYKQAFARAGEIGDLHTLAAVALNLGALQSDAGAYGDALVATERATRELGRMGATAELGTALFNAANLFTQIGELGAARRALARAREEGARRGSVDLVEGFVTFVEADLERRAGEPARAARLYRDAALRLSAAGQAQAGSSALLSQAEALAEAGLRDEARQALSSAIRQRRAHPAVPAASAVAAPPVDASPVDASASIDPGAAADALGGVEGDDEELAMTRARVLLAAGAVDRPEVTAAALAPALRRIADRAAALGRLPAAWRAALCAARLWARRGDRALGNDALTFARRLFEEVRMATPERFRPGLESDPEARWLAHPGGEDAAHEAALAARAAQTEGRLRRLLRINKRLNSELRLPRLLEMIVDTVIELTDAERGFLLLEDESGHLVVKVARNIDQRTLDAAEFELSRSIARQAALGGEPIITVDAAGDARFSEAMSVSDLHLRSILAVPLQIKGRSAGTIYVDHRLRKGAFGSDAVSLVLDFAEQAAIAVENARLLGELRRRERQVEALNRRLEVELSARREELSGIKQELRENREALAVRYDYRNIVGRTPRMLDLFRLLDRITDTALPAVIQGESGTGKELVARAIHFNGPRRDRPFVSENCAAIPETLLESTLFGYARGAFTGADHDTRGLFEVADGGTLFLDEVAEMSPGMQGKLLRVLQAGEFRRVGSERTRKVDVRIVTATNRDLARMVEEGKFRQDLYFRLNVARIFLPPLRERREDVPLIVAHLMAKHAAQAGQGGGKVVEPSAMARLTEYRWPGNVRELENEIMRALAMSGQRIGVDDLSPHVAAKGEGGPGMPEDPDSLLVRPRVERLERSLIREALARCANNQTKAAEALGLSRFGLQKKLRRYNFA